MRAVEVAEPSQVAHARRAATAQAHALNLPDAVVGRVAIVITELATNLVKHGGGGALLIGGFDDETGSGLQCLALDRGAGMADLEAAMRDGHSTAGTPGTGLGAVSRGADLMEIYSRPGLGTAILARLDRDADRPRRTALPAHGVVAVPIAGEEISGDAWHRTVWDGGWAAMVADGLGHGPHAAAAAGLAVQHFSGAERTPPSELLGTLHAALRPTRGAAVSIAQVDSVASRVVFAGVGNVSGALFWPDGQVRRMVCNHGTIGHVAKHMHPFTYDATGAALLVLASDGLASSWRLEGYPGLVDAHPTLVAGVLYRDFSRGRDDTTVLVCRLNAP